VALFCPDRGALCAILEGLATNRCLARGDDVWSTHRGVYASIKLRQPGSNVCGGANKKSELLNVCMGRYTTVSGYKNNS